LPQVSKFADVLHYFHGIELNSAINEKYETCVYADAVDPHSEHLSMSRNRIVSKKLSCEFRSPSLYRTRRKQRDDEHHNNTYSDFQKSPNRNLAWRVIELDQDNNAERRSGAGCVKLQYTAGENAERYGHGCETYFEAPIVLLPKSF
jgi:hypothetical protein